MGYSVLKTQHVSLQFDDSRKQQAKDVEKLFTKGKQFPIKTGTESGPDNANYDLVKKFAKEFNHRVKFSHGNWVAVDRAIAKPGSFKAGEVMVVKNTDLVGRMHHRAFPFLKFSHVDDRVGRIAQASVHYAPRGAKPADPNFEANMKYALAIQRFMATSSRRGALSFVNGDFNMSDRSLDWAFNHLWSSMADRLKTWHNTGHGPIDGFASFDRDKRVRPKKFVVLNDKQMFMHTDHFVCRGTWIIRHLKV